MIRGVLASSISIESVSYTHLFVYNSQGAGQNLRFGMDVDLVINDVDYKGTVTDAPDLSLIHIYRPGGMPYFKQYSPFTQTRKEKAYYMGLLTKIFGNYSEKEIKRIIPIKDKVLEQMCIRDSYSAVINCLVLLLHTYRGTSASDISRNCVNILDVYHFY